MIHFNLFNDIWKYNAVVERDIIYAIGNDFINGTIFDVLRFSKKLLIKNHSLCFNTERINMGFDFIYNYFENYLKTGKTNTIIDKKVQY